MAIESDAMASEQRKRHRRRPIWLLGAIFGEIVWGLAVLAAYATEAYESMFPEWMQQHDWPDTLGTISSVIAAPIAIGGWLVVWGDAWVPPPWVNSVAFNVSFGICFYALVGAFVGASFAKIWPDRFTTWRLLIAVSVVILLLGIGITSIEWLN